MKHKNFNLSVIASIVLLTACGGSGSGDPVAEPTATPSATATPSPSGTPTPSPSGTPTATPTPTPTACVGEAISFVGPSRVFKGCDAANVATYYDITECVRDSTGLIWEGKTLNGGGGLRDASRTFTNFDNPAKEQVINLFPASGENPYRRPTNAEITASTNSLGYQNAVNATNLCGLNSWRRPTLSELSDAAGDLRTGFFPNVVNNTNYLSSDGVQQGFGHIESSAFTFNPYTANESLEYRISSFRLILVHQDPNIPRRAEP